MNRKAVKELLHIKGWLDRVDEIFERGNWIQSSDPLIPRRNAFSC